MSALHFTDLAISRLSTSGTYYDELTPAFGIRIGKHRKGWFVIRGRERLCTPLGLYGHQHRLSRAVTCRFGCLLVGPGPEDMAQPLERVSDAPANLPTA
jgi:hypothetical protein